VNVSAGRRLGSYEILSALGAGGMGEVYRARDIKLGREVAWRFDIMPDGRIVGVGPAGQSQSGSPAPPEIDVVLNWFEELKARVPTKE
jgi:serine/threonine protein kinase